MGKYKVGIDVGSTTIKVLVIDENNNIKYSTYKRHFSDIKTTLKESLKQCYEFIGNRAYCYKMIGNAVPVNFAKSIADSLYRIIK